MKKYILLALIIPLLVTISCTDRDDNIEFANIRIKNTNDFAYDSVQVGAIDHIFVNIAAGEFSEYLEFEKAYENTYVKIDTTESSFTLQPIDTIGQTPLPIGFYTYELNVDEEGAVSLEFKLD